MGSVSETPSGPDLAAGIPDSQLPDGGMLTGHVGEAAVLLTRRGNEVFAVSAHCTHYSGPLAEGVVVGDTIRCPWHHACFNLRTGEASAPALNPLTCWRVERAGGQIRVTAGLPPKKRATVAPANLKHVVIIGGGAAGNSAAQTLRDEGFGGEITLISADMNGPYDRPNLSKDYLAGTAPEEWIPLRPDSYFEEHKIVLRTATAATAVDSKERTVALANGERIKFDALLIATGAVPIRLPVAGADMPHVHTLRSLADSRAIVKAAVSAKRAVVIGASFIGLEAAASLRQRGLDVTVVAPEHVPLERILGKEIGEWVQRIHTRHGIKFALDRKPVEIGPKSVMLSDGSEVLADFVVMGVGVRPTTALAQSAGAAMENGVLVDETMQTSVPGIFAAGDIARFPWRGRNVRIEHWTVAQHQGEVAARNMLGKKTAYTKAPFFWSMHYDQRITFVGYNEGYDRTTVEGDLHKNDWSVTYWKGVDALAMASVGRDRANLEFEAALEARS